MAIESRIIAAFTEEQTARLTGISRQQLRYWDRTGFFSPGIASADRRALFGRLYTFRDLVSLKVLNALRNDANVPLPHLREVRQKLAHLGDDLWARTTLFVLNRKVIFQNPELDIREEVVSGQAILEIPLLVVANGIEEAVKTLFRRDASQIGKIERQRHIARNAPVIAGTRIPVRSIKAFAEAGYTPEQIGKEYPSLALDDIKAAIAFSEAA